MGKLLARMKRAKNEADLVWLPDIAKASGAGFKEDVLQLWREGAIELRPEGGIGRLSKEDAALLPIGAGGVPLSWARILEKKKERSS